VQPPVETSEIPALRDLLACHAESYETIVLVAHSHGGLVAKLLIIDEMDQGRSADLPVDLVVTFGTPRHGYRRLSVAALPLLRALSVVPGIGAPDDFCQVADPRRCPIERLGSRRVRSGAIEPLGSPRPRRIDRDVQRSGT
jgi:hypothetical protein